MVFLQSPSPIIYVIWFYSFILDNEATSPCYLMNHWICDIQQTWDMVGVDRIYRGQGGWSDSRCNNTAWQDDTVVPGSARQCLLARKALLFWSVVRLPDFCLGLATKVSLRLSMTTPLPLTQPSDPPKLSNMQVIVLALAEYIHDAHAGDHHPLAPASSTSWSNRCSLSRAILTFVVNYKSSS